MPKTILLPILLFASVTAQATILTHETFQLEIDDNGQVVKLSDSSNDTNYAAKGQPSPILQILENGVFIAPTSATWDAARNWLTLHFGDKQLTLEAVQSKTHLTLELIDIKSDTPIDRIQWGPIATNISDNVGEVIGVVRNKTYAIGMVGMNPKTLGGPVDNDEARDVSRSRSAMPTQWGSTLQAYSIDRTRPRKADVWGGHFADMPIPPIPGETLIGSKVAFFGVPASKALDRIGDIELAEGLPHPMYNGTWSKQNPDLGRSYLIASFTEETIDQMIAYAKRGNFLSLYHPNPFKSWGHYTLREDHFPNGEAGMKACVEKATKAGLLIGGHTLTNFINTNDAYVTPIPDKRLAKTGSSILVKDTPIDAIEIEVASPEFFNNEKANWLHTVMIGEELIRYSSVSETAPWKLLDCQRGAWKTVASAHNASTEVGKLLDHPYNVFFTNYEMQSEVAMNLANLFNATGMNHFDFDGHEGCHSSGQGDFALEMFAKTIYDNTDHFLHNGTSNSETFYWHINTCCNWGEPWYGGFRSSMAEYRINNLAMLERNFMPKMLGWFQFTSNTTLADIEWLMARSAGYGSGFALTTDPLSLKANPNTDALLSKIADWENLRMVDAFTDTQRELMRDSNREFHLSGNEASGFAIAPINTSDLYEYEFYERQPGEPTFAEWTYNQRDEAQALRFTVEAEGEEGSIDNIILEFDNYLRFEIPFTIEHGETVVCDGTNTLRLYDETGRQKNKHALEKNLPQLEEGTHSIKVTCDFRGDTPPTLNAQFKSLGANQPGIPKL